MSSAERPLNSSQPKAEPAIETVYTTVESQPDPSDLLTVISNLRQINRQLVEQVARLEQALASSKQSLYNYEELCQKYQQQSQKLTKTEQVAVELHRRLKQQTRAVAAANPAATLTPNELTATSDLATVAEDPVTDTLATKKPHLKAVIMVEDTPKIPAIQPSPPQSEQQTPPTLDTRLANDRS